MKKHSFLLIAGFALLLFLLPGCKKGNSPAPKTNTDLLVQASWKFSSATVGGTDVSAFLQACQKDNILAFASAGTGTVDEGPVMCNSGDIQINPFTWSFQSGETVLFISATLFTGGNSTFTLVTLTETQLVVSQNITVSGSSQNAVVTFIH